MQIPLKPEGLTFTDAQWKAIWATGKDILVSAAAGSGKTKVLITRMIEKVLDETNRLMSTNFSSLHSPMHPPQKCGIVWQRHWKRQLLLGRNLSICAGN